ncbi:hypothetical protein [Streptomyces decoyicus]|nr:hypothetical protein OG532_18290 [Streptomyces decoyicus]
MLIMRGLPFVSAWARAAKQANASSHRLWLWWTAPSTQSPIAASQWPSSR